MPAAGGTRPVVGDGLGFGAEDGQRRAIPKRISIGRNRVRFYGAPQPTHVPRNAALDLAVISDQPYARSEGCGGFCGDDPVGKRRRRTPQRGLRVDTRRPRLGHQSQQPGTVGVIIGRHRHV